MAIKKVKSKEKSISLVQIAEELNEVMQYGVDPETGEVDTSQQIDTELEEEALYAEVIKSAKEDLAMNDEDSFSVEVWKWFLNEGVVPAGMEEEEELEEDAYISDALEASSEEEENEEVVEEPAPVKSKKNDKKAVKETKEKKAPTPVKEEKKAAVPKAKEEKKIKKQPAIREKKERGPSNEVVAVEMYKAGKTVEDFIKKFTQIYLERGKDAAFGEKRGKDYYGFAVRILGEKPGNKIGGREEKAPVIKEKAETKIKEKPVAKEKTETKTKEKPEKKLAKKIKK